MISFFVPGVPVPQGSGNIFKGRFVHAGGRKLAEWRRWIALCASRQRVAGPIDVAVRVELSFSLPRPRTVRRQHASAKPDVDKLARGALDALTGVMWTDDSRVVDLRAIKRYGDPGLMVVIENLESEKT